MSYTGPYDTVRSTSRAAVIVSLSALLAACSDSTSTSRTPAQIAFTSGITSTANLQVVPITGGGHTLNITQATLTITRVELKPTKTDVCAGDDGADGNLASFSSTSDDNGNDACEELKAGPLSVDLPLDGGITTLPANAIPAGTFREIELRVSSAFRRDRDGERAWRNRVWHPARRRRRIANVGHDQRACRWLVDECGRDARRSV
jgi:hypothetical protein